MLRNSIYPIGFGVGVKPPRSPKAARCMHLDPIDGTRHTGVVRGATAEAQEAHAGFVDHRFGSRVCEQANSRGR